MSKETIKAEVEDRLKGACMVDEITKKDMIDALNDLDTWLENAKDGDVYYYHDEGFVYHMADDSY